MLLSDFIKSLQAIEAESAGTHHFGGRVDVEFCIDGDNLDFDIELNPSNPVEPWVLNCGCTTGAVVNLRVRVGDYANE